MSPVYVVVSGYFDPIHAGHIEYIEKAKKLGDKLIVIVNNDEQAKLKKGQAFMPCAERVKILRSLKVVDLAVLSVDKDRTVCETLKMLQPDVFCNGGDQSNDSIPETKICLKLGIKLVDGLGQKIQSSSWLIHKAKQSSEQST
jgi:cytidyltransferase-like protein